MGGVGRSIPDWIKAAIPGGNTFAGMNRVIRDAGLHTVCSEAKCPNRGECFCSGTATFLILGDTCTRHCGYCAVKTGIPEKPDTDEPERLAAAVHMIGLKYAVVTSVTRDDLPDGGAGIFCQVLRAIRLKSPGTRVELLIPDFLNCEEGSLDRVIAAVPDVINHNIEVVRTLFPQLRPQGNYAHSLSVLERIARSGIPAKSGLMIGFGESIDDIVDTLRDLRSAGCSLLTVGQYLRSRRDGHPVARYWHPDEFSEITRIAEDIGFARVYAAPMVRSSYHAEAMIGPCS